MSIYTYTLRWSTHIRTATPMVITTIGTPTTQTETRHMCMRTLTKP